MQKEIQKVTTFYKNAKECLPLANVQASNITDEQYDEHRRMMKSLDSHLLNLKLFADAAAQRSFLLQRDIILAKSR